MNRAVAQVVVAETVDGEPAVPDLARCQAEVRSAKFTMRCTDKPVVLIEEKHSWQARRPGALALCRGCFEVLQRFPTVLAEFHFEEI